MHTQTLRVLSTLFAELTEGPVPEGGAFILNSGDRGLLRALDDLSHIDASRSVHDGATVAAHALHVSFGLSLMNQWAAGGGNPFSDARWDVAWRTTEVDAKEWEEIRQGLRAEARRWRAVLESPREVTLIELTGLVASVAHLAYHLGAIRQIVKGARGPKEGTFR